MGYFLRSDWGLGLGARKDLAGACQGHPFCEVWGPFQGTLFGVSRGCVWEASVAVFRSRFCTESVQNCVRIPYTILDGLRTRKFARGIFFLRRPDFRVQNPTQFLVRILTQIFVRIPYTKPQNASPLARAPPGPYGPRVRIPYTFLVAF